jgi:hypothetical protein
MIPYSSCNTSWRKTGELNIEEKSTKATQRLVPFYDKAISLTTGTPAFIANPFQFLLTSLPILRAILAILTSLTAFEHRRKEVNRAYLY